MANPYSALALSDELDPRVLAKNQSKRAQRRLERAALSKGAGSSAGEADGAGGGAASPPAAREPPVPLSSATPPRASFAVAAAAAQCHPCGWLEEEEELFWGQLPEAPAASSADVQQREAARVPARPAPPKAIPTLPPAARPTAAVPSPHDFPPLPAAAESAPWQAAGRRRPQPQPAGRSPVRQQAPVRVVRAAGGGCRAASPPPSGEDLHADLLLQVRWGRGAHGRPKCGKGCCQLRGCK